MSKKVRFKNGTKNFDGINNISKIIVDIAQKFLVEKEEILVYELDNIFKNYKLDNIDIIDLVLNEIDIILLKLDRIKKNEIIPLLLGGGRGVSLGIGVDDIQDLNIIFDMLNIYKDVLDVDDYIEEESESEYFSVEEIDCINDIKFYNIPKKDDIKDDCEFL